MSIRVDGVSKSFGAFKALDNVSLDVPQGTLLALRGPSGSGKTTLLRIIAGLEWPDSGRIAEDGTDITDRHARQREVGFVFQHYALFRHMSVFENIAFGMELGRLLAALEIEDLGKDGPHQAALDEEVEAAEAMGAFPDLVELFADPLGADLGDVGRDSADGLPGAWLDLEAEEGREADGAEEAQVILAKAIFGAANGADEAGL
jgi:ABC-type sugar transport system ATPase subunit